MASIAEYPLVGGVDEPDWAPKNLTNVLADGTARNLNTTYNTHVSAPKTRPARIRRKPKPAPTTIKSPPPITKTALTRAA